MKNQIMLLLLVSTFAFVSCGIDKTPLTEDQKKYAGKWVSTDGSWIHILNDGTGSLEHGATSVSGGQATISANQIEIGLFGINKTYTIDSPPYDEDGKKKMKLNGAVFTKQ